MISNKLIDHVIVTEDPAASSGDEMCNSADELEDTEVKGENNTNVVGYCNLIILQTFEAPQFETD